MNDLINEARELASKATDGPWVSGIYQSIVSKFSKICNADTDANAAFIARSRTLVPELADALEKAEGELKLYHDSADACEYMTSTDCDYCINMINLTARVEKAEAELVKEREWTNHLQTELGKAFEIGVQVTKERDELAAYKEANPPRVHGEWVLDHMTGDIAHYAKCSVCGKIRFFQSEAAQYDFCPECGAIMDGKGPT